MSSGVKTKSIFAAFNLWAILICSMLFAVPAFAHGGEDHGDDKAVAVATGSGTIVQTIKVGDKEAMFKHQQFEPDRPLTARLFVTQFATNEVVSDAEHQRRAD